MSEKNNIEIRLAEIVKELRANRIGDGPVRNDVFARRIRLQTERAELMKFFKGCPNINV